LALVTDTDRLEVFQLIEPCGEASGVAALKHLVATPQGHCKMLGIIFLALFLFMWLLPSCLLLFSRRPEETYKTILEVGQINLYAISNHDVG
jgi:hypothetical protein